jgi:hypothetical protein
MPDPSEASPRSETDIAVSELARGKAERLVLGSNPYGSMMRIVLAILLFVVVFGSVFFFIQR